MNRLCLASLIALALVVAPRAQDVAPDDAALAEDSSAAAHGFVVVETNLPDGLLFDGDTLLGRAYENPYELAPGPHRLTLREANAEAWRAREATLTFELAPGEATVVRLDVPYRYRVESFPYGATVTWEGPDGKRVLGETPLTAEFDAPLRGDIVVERPGHRAARQPAGEAADNAYSVVLKPLDAFDAATAEVGLAERRRPNVWIDVAAAGLALGAGAVAVYYKQKGDERYDAYARSGDPQLRPEFERYDTYSAVALGAMQVGLGVLAVRLVLR